MPSTKRLVAIAGSFRLQDQNRGMSKMMCVGFEYLPGKAQTPGREKDFLEGVSRPVVSLKTGGCAASS
jgi:hypothetical protein